MNSPQPRESYLQVDSHPLPPPHGGRDTRYWSWAPSVRSSVDMDHLREVQWPAPPEAVEEEDDDDDDSDRYSDDSSTEAGGSLPASPRKLKQLEIEYDEKDHRSRDVGGHTNNPNHHHYHRHPNVAEPSSPGVTTPTTAATTPTITPRQMTSPVKPAPIPTTSTYPNYDDDEEEEEAHDDLPPLQLQYTRTHEYSEKSHYMAMEQPRYSLEPPPKIGADGIMSNHRASIVPTLNGDEREISGIAQPEADGHLLSFKFLKTWRKALCCGS